MGREAVFETEQSGKSKREVNLPLVHGQHGERQRERSRSSVRNQKDAANELKAINKARGGGEVQERSNHSLDAEPACEC